MLPSPAKGNNKSQRASVGSLLSPTKYKTPEGTWQAQRKWHWCLNIQPQPLMLLHLMSAISSILMLRMLLFVAVRKIFFYLKLHPLKMKSQMELLVEHSFPLVRNGTLCYVQLLPWEEGPLLKLRYPAKKDLLNIHSSYAKTRMLIYQRCLMKLQQIIPLQ